MQTNVDQLYPSPRAVADALPTSAKTYLKQAFDTLSSPDAATMMAASAVDAMLKESHYEEGSLYTRIDKAVTDHVLTEGMGKWAHAVRLEANNVRHSDASNPHTTPDQAKQVVEFAEALGNFLFVLTAQIKTATTAAAQVAPKPKK